MIAARAVIHINVADFAVAVERVLEPRLRERPLIVAPEGAPRACVFDMSEEAYRAGVRKGMPLERARRIERDAEVLPPHRDRYERAMRALLDLARPYTPLLEAADENGHLFLDVTGTGRLFGPPPDVAWRIRRAAQHELGLRPIWSAAPNKLLAKVASRLVKPAGEESVEAGDEEDFLRAVPLHLLPGIEREELERLRAFRFLRAGEVAALTLAQLEVALGQPQRARRLHALVRGIDHTPVLPVDARRPVVAAEHAFATDRNDAAAVQGALYGLVESAGRELRARGLAARRVAVRLEYADGVRCLRSAKAADATAGDLGLYACALIALERAWLRRVRVRHLRLVCDRLVYPPALLELFPEEDRRARCEAGLCRALDAIRRKFGNEAVRVGRTLPAGEDA